MAWSVELADDGSVLLHTQLNDTLLGDSDLKHLSDTLIRLRAQRLNMGMLE